MTTKIIFTGDLLRPNLTMTANVQAENIIWLKRLVSPFLTEALTACAIETETGASGTLHIAEIYRKAGLPVGDAAWAKLYCDGHPTLSRALAERFAGSVAIGFEMPPSFTDALSQAGTPWIDIAIHPIRFTDDLLLGVRTSSHFNYDFGAERGLETAFHRAAGAIGAMAAKRRDWRLQHPLNSTLFVGQMITDRSMIREGRLMRPADLQADLQKALVDRPNVLFKPHPYERNDAMLNAVKTVSPEARVVTDNIYALLACDQITDVVTVSSSVGEEARYFGKRVHYLVGPSTPIQGHAAPGEAYWTLEAARILSPGFWRSVLSDVAPVSNTPLEERCETRPDLLRITQQNYWGYDGVVNDTILRHSPEIARMHNLGPALRVMELMNEILKSRFFIFMNRIVRKSSRRNHR